MRHGLQQDPATARAADLPHPPAGLEPSNIYLFGPPGVGKSAVGRALAQRLGRTFVDGDGWIETRQRASVAEIFAGQGEQAFRRLERQALAALAPRAGLVVACGGGMLLDPANRAAAEASGTVVCLTCETQELVQRAGDGAGRPLLEGDPQARLEALLRSRQSAYLSFPLQVDTSGRSLPEVVEAVVDLLRRQPPLCLQVAQGSGYQVWLGTDLFEDLPGRLREAGLGPPYALISDDRVGALYGERVGQALGVAPLVFPQGEGSKTLDAVARLHAALARAGMERGGTLVALGGGVVGDVAGFVAATHLRGLRWVNLPTTLLAMVDAGVGGKVGVDLPQGKNLVGAFHPPALVLAEAGTLATLPAAEFRAGMAEVVKAALIGDPQLFGWMEAEGAQPTVRWLERSLKVKIALVERDPLEQGPRARLNLGHTVAHGLEAASGYRWRHGEAVAVGLVAEARLAQALGMAEAALDGRIEAVLRRLGLPTRYRGLEPGRVRAAMEWDKKRAGGRLRFALPIRPGEVREGCEVLEEALMETLAALREGP